MVSTGNSLTRFVMCRNRKLFLVCEWKVKWFFKTPEDREKVSFVFDLSSSIGYAEVGKQLSKNSEFTVYKNLKLKMICLLVMSQLSQRNKQFVKTLMDGTIGSPKFYKIRVHKQSSGLTKCILKVG